MKSLGKIILYLLATVILGAFLAPPLYWGAHWLAAHGVLAWIAENPFRKFFHRALLVAAIALLWPTARWLKVRNVSALGLHPNPHRWRDLFTGFASAFLMMAVLGAVMMTLHIVKWRGHFHWHDLTMIAGTAFVVAILEEWLFRGAILGLLVRTMRPFWAVFWMSALFSILHFLKPDDASPHHITWLTGFQMIPGAFAQFKQPLLLLGGFTTLFCVSWILGTSRFKTRSLWLPIGLHAGWVFGIKTFALTTRRIVDPRHTLPWFGETLYVGLGSVLAVLLTGLLVRFYLRKR